MPGAHSFLLCQIPARLPVCDLPSSGSNDPPAGASRPSLLRPNQPPLPVQMEPIRLSGGYHHRSGCSPSSAPSTLPVASLSLKACLAYSFLRTVCDASPELALPSTPYPLLRSAYAGWAGSYRAFCFACVRLSSLSMAHMLLRVLRQVPVAVGSEHETVGSQSTVPFALTAPRSNAQCCGSGGARSLRHFVSQCPGCFWWLVLTP